MPIIAHSSHLSLSVPPSCHRQHFKAKFQVVSLQAGSALPSRSAERTVAQRWQFGRDDGRQTRVILSRLSIKNTLGAQHTERKKESRNGRH